MAQILTFLRESNPKQQQGELVTRVANTDYQMQNQAFTLPLSAMKAEGGELQQYCGMYFSRLRQLKPVVKEAAELKWAKQKCRFMDNILDMKSDLSVIIGTLFKEQKNKPNVFTNITGPINQVSAIDCSFGISKD